MKIKFIEKSFVIAFLVGTQFGKTSPKGRFRKKITGSLSPTINYFLLAS